MAANIREEGVMTMIHTSFTYLLASWGAVTAVLVGLVIYGNTLSVREDDELYLNSAEQVMMASEQQLLIAKQHSLLRVVIAFAALSGILFLATASVWVWIGFHS
jgi:hypothetical protein